ncbi:MAG: DUF4911 domain-containing protein [Clostridia bacterium]|jgi:hypothetical protein|nr:DUF4911 domain-containing protein [Clostridia bacterium]
MSNPYEIPIRLPKQKIAFLMKIIEGYGHLGVLTTIDPGEALAIVRVTPDTAGEMYELLAQFSFVEVR